MKKKLLAILVAACVVLGVMLGAGQYVYANEANDPACYEPRYVLTPPKEEYS
ncbi:MAG: hypothetical protein FWC71_09370 [Defluviitaleaceae bacterium]|nr:hypothetical protein [Defluviitaleaceae bacterium]